MPIGSDKDESNTAAGRNNCSATPCPDGDPDARASMVAAASDSRSSVAAPPKKVPFVEVLAGAPAPGQGQEVNFCLHIPSTLNRFCRIII